ncbi:hypothetical protein BDV19DRAFT_370698 [Aspergillus venezuelensis]
MQFMSWRHPFSSLDSLGSDTRLSEYGLLQSTFFRTPRTRSSGRFLIFWSTGWILLDLVRLPDYRGVLFIEDPVSWGEICSASVSGTLFSCIPIPILLTSATASRNQNHSTPSPT